MSEPTKKKLVFMPGCFDQFEGTQEELDDLVAEIQRLADSGELFENSVPIEDLDDLDDPDDLDQISTFPATRQ